MANPRQRILASLFFTTLATAAYGQGFGSFLSGLQKALGSESQPSAGEAPAAQGKAGLGASMTERYCRNLFSMAAISKDTVVNEGLISEEFKLDSKEFFDAMLKSLDTKGGATSVAFPHPGFYRGEFETDKINVLYNLVLSYPSAQYMSVLIGEARKTQSSPQYDHQARNDAIAALAIIHYRMQANSVSKTRWQELIASLEGEEHYTGQVIRARLALSGEGGQKDPRKAITLAREANDLRSVYSREGGYRSMSPRNYQVRSNQTLYEAVTSNAGMVDMRNFEQFVQQYAAFKNNPNVAPELEAQLGPSLKQIDRAATSARVKAEGLLVGANAVGKLKAQKASLDSSTRTRVSNVSDVNANTRAMAAIAKELEKIQQFDEKQKVVFASALADAHESGDLAISMMPTMMVSALNLMAQRGFQAMPAFLPYSQAFQNYSDNACTVITRWDHAAEKTQVPTTPDAAIRSKTASALNLGD